LESGGVLVRTDDAVTLTVDLQPDFALDQPLALFALAAFELLDKDDPGYALDVLSVIEATLEDPRQVLSAQRKKARGEAVQEMKMKGIEYEERMVLLEDISYPKPLEELLTAAYAIYQQTNPWILDHELKPKSVARDLYENAMTFNEYVGFHGLGRSEGLVLRAFADAYKALKRSVPDALRTEEVEDITLWLGELVRQVDSSLLDEWAQLTAGGGLAPEPPPQLTRSTRAFRVLVRNAMWQQVQLIAQGRSPLDTECRFLQIDTGADARGPDFFRYDASSVIQVLKDREGHHDWAVMAELDLAASDDAGEAVLTNLRLAELGPDWL
ncbi:MAG: dead/deah box helicase protein, partial [Frankiales bacterium]|nr:dead/deah box helicase protein [Frankiales bacterium]